MLSVLYTYLTRYLRFRDLYAIDERLIAERLHSGSRREGDSA